MTGWTRLLALSLWLALPAWAGEGDSTLFSFQQLSFPERSVARRVADLNGDARLDLLLALESPSRPDAFRLASCLQEQDGRFSGSCGSLELADDVRSFDVCRAPAEPGPDRPAPDGPARAATLVLLTADGVSQSGFEGGRFLPPSRLVELRTLLAGTDPGRPQMLRVCFDLDGDGHDELLLPTARGPALLRLDGSAAPLVLESPAEVRFSWRGRDRPGLELFLWPRDFGRRTQTRVTSPDLHVGDFDGDGRPDVVTALENTLRVFRQRADGSFPARPDATLSRARAGHEADEDELQGEATAFADLDGDGRADLIVLRFGGEVRSRMDRSIYFARPDGRYPEEPDQIVRSEGLDPSFTIHDVNGDGRRDLVVPYMHIAPSQAVRAFTRQVLRLQLRVYLMREDGRYAQDAGKRFVRTDRRLVLDYGFDVFELIRSGRSRPAGVTLSPLIVSDADVNGDGFADVLADDGDDRLRVFLGNANADYGRAPDHQVALESALAFDVLDLDGDGTSDVVSWYGADHVRVEPSPPPTKEERQRARLSPGRAPGRAPGREPGPQAVAPVPPAPETRVKILMGRPAR